MKEDNQKEGRKEGIRDKKSSKGELPSRYDDVIWNQRASPPYSCCDSNQSEVSTNRTQTLS